MWNNCPPEIKKNQKWWINSHRNRLADDRLLFLHCGWICFRKKLIWILSIARIYQHKLFVWLVSLSWATGHTKRVHVHSGNHRPLIRNVINIQFGNHWYLIICELRAMLPVKHSSRYYIIIHRQSFFLCHFPISASCCKSNDLILYRIDRIDRVPKLVPLVSHLFFILYLCRSLPRELRI